MPDRFMNTKEVAEYLGIHEKQVYALIKAQKIPCTRATGKWLFPKHLIDAWIEGEAKESIGGSLEASTPQPNMIISAGSNDPILDILLSRMGREYPDLHIFHSNTGSLRGLNLLHEGLADIVWCHLFDADSGEYNVPYIKDQLPEKKIAIVHLFCRELGLLVAPAAEGKVKEIKDLTKQGIRFINRQEGAGTRIFLDQELSRAGIDPENINGYENEVNTHMEVALAVIAGNADAGLGTVSVARMFGLPFVPLTRESFDMVLGQETFFMTPIQAFMEILKTCEVQDSVKFLGNYDFSEAGKIIYSAH